MRSKDSFKARCVLRLPWFLLNSWGFKCGDRPPHLVWRTRSIILEIRVPIEDAILDLIGEKWGENFKLADVSSHDLHNTYLCPKKPRYLSMIMGFQL